MFKNIVLREPIKSEKLAVFEIDEEDLRMRITLEIVGEGPEIITHIIRTGPVGASEGEYFVRNPVLILEPVDANAHTRRRVPLALEDLVLFTTSPELKPRPVHPTPIGEDTPLSVTTTTEAGLYKITLELELGYIKGGKRIGGRKVLRQPDISFYRSYKLGSVEIPRALEKPRLIPMEERFINWVDKKAILSELPPEVTPGSSYPLAPENVLREELLTGANVLWDIGWCPWASSHREAPHVQWYNERCMGFYLEALCKAYRLTGDKRFWPTIRYAEQMITANCYPAPTGKGYWFNINGFKRGENILRIGIICVGLWQYYLMTGDITPLETARSVLEPWPYNWDTHQPQRSIDYRGDQPLGDFVYNMIGIWVYPAYAIGKTLDIEDLRKRAEDAVVNRLLPDQLENGFWKYNRGGGISSHYGVLLIRLLVYLASFKGWRSRPVYMDALRRAVDYAIGHYSWRHGKETPHIAWSAYNTNQYVMAEAYFKAAVMTNACSFLGRYLNLDYLKIAEGSLRYLYSQRLTPEFQKLRAKSWFYQSVYSPLLDLTELGIKCLGDPAEPEYVKLWLD